MRNRIGLFVFALSMIFINTIKADKGAIGDRILLHDDLYNVRYGGVMEPAIQFFAAHGFKKMDTVELLKWLKERVTAQKCHGTVILQISDVTPRELVDPMDKTSLFYRYCEQGGRWVMPGGSTLSAFEGKDDFTIMLQSNQFSSNPENFFIAKCFGIHRVYGLRGKGERQVTSEGKKWGLGKNADKWLKFLLNAVPVTEVMSLVETPANQAALVWLKNINPAYPYSGLVGLCVSMSGNESLLEMIYRLCVFNGQPVGTIAKIDWRKKECVPEYRISFSSTIGKIPRQAFQRGETIPLAIHAYGEKVNGQAVTGRLTMGGRVVWEKTWDAGVRKSLKVCENIDTTLFRCGEYKIEGFIGDQKVTDDRIWICPARRHNPFPFFVCKMHRKNLNREQVALTYLRDHYVNGMIFDLYQLEDADKSPAIAKRLGSYLDLLLKNNLAASAKVSCMKLYTDKKDEMLVLYDGSNYIHGGIHHVRSWRGFRSNHLNEYRSKLRKQVNLLKNSKSPVIVPSFITNDDGSVGGNYDFNSLTMAELKKKTGLTRNDLPPLKKLESGLKVFMPVVEPGVIEDKHPWLTYFRFHCGNYNAICQAAMEGMESAWPGSLVADIGCMSGPLYIPRGYYPPLSANALNTASFYQYLFWFHAYPFAMETARMGNRDKPVGLTISASLIAWGAVFQRATLYRILAEAPEFIGLWSLDARRFERYDREEQTWEGTRSVTEKVAKVAGFIKKQKLIPSRGALFFGLAQNCFKLTDKHMRPYYMRTALENFLYAGAKLDLICTEEILEGKLDSYDVVFINSHQWMTKGVKGTLENYIKSGGTVVVDSETTIDIAGAKKADGPFGTGLNDLGMADRVKRCKKYVDQYLKPTLVKAVSEYTVVRANVVDETPLVWVIDVETTDDSRALLKAQNKDWETGVYNYLNKKAELTPVMQKKIAIKSGWHAYDLWNGKELVQEPLADKEWSVAEMPVECLGAVPVVFYRNRIESLKLRSATGTLKAGDGFSAFFELVSDNGTPIQGVVPANVMVYGPNGDELWEYGGNALINNGTLAVAFSTAVNDQPGKWTVKVRELASRKEQSIEFEIGTRLQHSN